MKTSNFSRLQVSDVRFLPDAENFSSSDWLISISDTDSKPVKILLPFEKILHISFNDINSEFIGSITNNQACCIADFIQRARYFKVNLWVNCHAGVSRSGAIVELLSQLGWTIDESIRSRARIPNSLVYEKIRKFFPNENIRDLKPITEYLGNTPTIML